MKYHNYRLIFTKYMKLIRSNGVVLSEGHLLLVGNNRTPRHSSIDSMDSKVLTVYLHKKPLFNGIMPDPELVIDMEYYNYVLGELCD